MNSLDFDLGYNPVGFRFRLSNFIGGTAFPWKGNTQYYCAYTGARRKIKRANFNR
jgi:hypothetical protein